MRFLHYGRNDRGHGRNDNGGRGRNDRRGRGRNDTPFVIPKVVAGGAGPCSSRGEAAKRPLLSSRGRERSDRVEGSPERSGEIFEIHQVFVSACRSFIDLQIFNADEAYIHTVKLITKSLGIRILKLQTGN